MKPKHIEPFDPAAYIDTRLALRCNIYVLGLADGTVYPGVYEEVPDPPHTDAEREQMYAARRLYLADPEANRKVFDELIRAARSSVLTWNRSPET